MIKQEIINFVKAIGIDKIGFAKDGNKTVIAVLFPYYVKGETGNIAMYARGIDYHRVGQAKLAQICEFLVSLGVNECEIHIDKGKRDDRQAAYDAGLGFFGKNSLLINDDYGSYFVIGQILTDIEIETDAPLEKSCQNCSECIKKCQGNALDENGFNLNNCVSHISQLKGELNDEQIEKLRKSSSCFGCDACQAVCPHNFKLETTAIKEFMTDRITTITTKDIEGLSNRDFMKKYGNYAFSWRGKKVLERNIDIVSG